VVYSDQSAARASGSEKSRPGRQSRTGAFLYSSNEPVGDVLFR
jgi:hypothetical protein